MGSGKTQGVKIFKGSLKTHWIMYINSVDLAINPACVNGMSMQARMIRMMLNMDSQFIQPGFQFNTKMTQPKSYYEPSRVHFKFVNGYEKVFNPAITTHSAMMSEIKLINKHIEFERNLQGQDDELEDDA